MAVIGSIDHYDGIPSIEQPRIKIQNLPPKDDGKDGRRYAKRSFGCENHGTKRRRRESEESLITQKERRKASRTGIGRVRTRCACERGERGGRFCVRDIVSEYFVGLLLRKRAGEGKVFEAHGIVVIVAL